MENTPQYFFIFTAPLAISLCSGFSEGDFSTFRKVAEDSKIVVQNGTESFLNETVDSELQCLMKRYEFHYLVEVMELPNDQFHCQFFKKKFGDVSVVSSANRSVYDRVLPELCQDLGKGEPDGEYEISPGDGEKMEVFCDMTRNGGGWTTFQRRFDGSVDFFRKWVDYKEGFGSADGEYWLGLDHIHQITAYYPNMLVRMEATAFDGDQAHLIYQNFYVEGAENLYKLHAGTFIGGDDSMKADWENHDGQYFSTHDNPNDVSNYYNCANFVKGAGWYKSCADYNFNGRYENSDIAGATSIFWKLFKQTKSLKSVSLSIKRRD